MGYHWAKTTLYELDFYQASRNKVIGDFPAIDCPQEYKDCLCALSGGSDLLGYLTKPLEAIGNRTLLQVLNEKDYPALQQYIYECVSLDIVGPGSY